MLIGISHFSNIVMQMRHLGRWGGNVEKLKLEERKVPTPKSHGRIRTKNKHTNTNTHAAHYYNYIYFSTNI